MVAEQTSDTMSMTNEQVKALLDGLLAGMKGNTGGGGSCIKKVLEDKMFTRLSKFGGVEREWKE